MRRVDAQNVVLVRAVEEKAPGRIAPELLLEAHAAAGEPAEGAPWIARRARYLVDHALPGLRAVATHGELVLPGVWPTVAAATLVGLAANYLGPSGRIHVVWNPIVVLVLWNLVVYAALAARRLLRRPPPAAPSPSAAPADGTRPSPPAATGAPAAYAPGPVERLLLGGVGRWLVAVRRRAQAGLDDSREAAAVARRFAVLWWPVVRPAAGAWLRRLVHLSAIGLAVGAVAGMYVRGLFLAYDVVWRSTFVHDPEIIGRALGVLLGPAALLLGRPPPGPDDAVRLLAPEGDPAAPWIHLYAVTALLFVVVPRALLAAAASRRLRRAETDVTLDFDAEYFRDLLRRAHAVSPEQLEATIRNAARGECGRFADRVAAFVAAELYDRRVVPRLRAFREEGGRLADLKAALRAECDAFAPALADELGRAQQDLEVALVGHVRRLLGDAGVLRAAPLDGLAGRLDPVSAGVAIDFGDRVGGDIGAVGAGIVSTSVAVAVGTVSGGFGEALGVALLVGLVESGPVGWVVGAIGGFVAAGAALWLGRDLLRQGIETIPLPGTVLKVALWPGRFERMLADGRVRCERSVRETLAGQMEALSTALGDHVWSGLRPALGEFQRPRVPVDQS